MRNSEVLAATFPNRVSNNYCSERSSFRPYKSTVKTLDVQVIDFKLELFGDAAGIRWAGDF
jgi:hypothetical protein